MPDHPSYPVNPPRERLQPCLLDRLTDDEPHSQVESRDKRVISQAQFRRSVLRDLSWLFNTSAPLESLEQDRDEAADFPMVYTSVVNFGLPDLCGYTASSLSVPQLERMLTEVIQRYEPRVLRRGLAVRALVDKSAYAHNALMFEIRGQVWSQPLPERLDLKTEVDLETGQVTLQERGGPGSPPAPPRPDEPSGAAPGPGDGAGAGGGGGARG